MINFLLSTLKNIDSSESCYIFIYIFCNWMVYKHDMGFLLSHTVVSSSVVLLHKIQRWSLLRHTGPICSKSFLILDPRKQLTELQYHDNQAKTYKCSSDFAGYSWLIMRLKQEETNSVLMRTRSSTTLAVRSGTLVILLYPVFPNLDIHG